MYYTYQRSNQIISFCRDMIIQAICVASVDCVVFQILVARRWTMFDTLYDVKWGFLPR